MRTSFKYLRPNSIDEAISMKNEHASSASFWAGGTDLTLHWRQEKRHPEYCIDLTYLKGLNSILVSENEIRIGAKTTLWSIERSGGEHLLLKTLSDVTKLMCTPQTRSIGTIGGNLCTASPAADLSPVLMAMEAEVIIIGKKGERKLLLEHFFKGVNKTALLDDEMLLEIKIPISKQIKKAASYKRVDRTTVDIALVNAASSISIDTKGVILDARISIGAVAPVVLLAENASKFLLDKHINEIDESLIRDISKKTRDISKPISDVRASADYRRNMVAVMTKRALLDTIEQLKG